MSRRSAVTSASSAASAAVIAFAAVAITTPGCSQGEGTGSANGMLDVPDCWSGPFDLKPDFFAAVPSTASFDALQLRIQHGGDYESFSDGIAILVDDAGQVRGDATVDGMPRPRLLGSPLVVTLSASVTPPGVPIRAIANPAIVHAALYLQKTCRTQNLALYAMDSVTLNADGSCQSPPAGQKSPTCGSPAILDGGGDGQAPTDDAAADAGAEGGGTAMIGTSSITFNSLFDGNPAEANAKDRLTDATFDFYFADPREVCAGGLGPAPRCRGHLSGKFKFYFERGRPAQPFP